MQKPDYDKILSLFPEIIKLGRPALDKLPKKFKESAGGLALLSGCVFLGAVFIRKLLKSHGTDNA